MGFGTARFATEANVQHRCVRERIRNNPIEKLGFRVEPRANHYVECPAAVQRQKDLPSHMPPGLRAEAPIAIQPGPSGLGTGPVQLSARSTGQNKYQLRLKRSRIVE